MPGNIAEQVLAGTDADLVARGFRRRSRDGRYVRTRPYGADIFYLLVSRFPGQISVTPDVAVRHETVERIFHRTSGYAPADQRTTPTIGGQLAEITHNPAFDLTIGAGAAPAELSRAAASLAGLVTGAEAYWARFSSLSEVDSTLNDRPEEPTPHRPMPWLRCSTGLIVARLTDRPGYAGLARIYHEQMREFSGGFYLPRFEALSTYLAERDPARLLAEHH